MEHIYILKLKENKYYIGKTKNIEKRWNEHLSGEGSGWKKKI
jgi:predicted GIY-YIG superfamily endonuclease